MFHPFRAMGALQRRVVRGEFRRLAGELCRFIIGRRIPIAGTTATTPFFVVGAGRSGTTLIRRIMQNSPGIHVPPESYFIRPVVEWLQVHRTARWSDIVPALTGLITASPDFRLWDLRPENVYTTIQGIPRSSRSAAGIIDAVFRLNAAACQKQSGQWGDKTPENAGLAKTISRVFPAARFVHALRDGVDVVYSMMKSLSYVDSIEHAAHEWRRRTSAIAAFPDRTRVITIRYEDLVSDPHAASRKLFAFIGAEYRDEYVDRNDTGEMADVPRMPHYENVTKPVFSTSVGRGRRELSRADLETLDGLIGDHLQALGYQRPVLDGEPAPPCPTGAD
jgi:protein-tyrosine sulfotransferase